MPLSDRFETSMVLTKMGRKEEKHIETSSTLHQGIYINAFVNYACSVRTRILRRSVTNRGSYVAAVLAALGATLILAPSQYNARQLLMDKVKQPERGQLSLQ
ncbi:hypothetical protein ACJJTC_006230 [Scirpophaga incertulas]